MRRASAAAFLLTAAHFVAVSSSATTFELEETRTEAWAMRWFAAVATPTGFGVAEGGEPWTWELALEGGYVPSLSEEERRVGFRGTKVEDINRVELFGRPIARLYLPAEFVLEAGWVPPVEIEGVKANLPHLALARPIWTGERARFGGRIFYLTGDVEGDITCPEEEVAAGDDPIANPFACEAVSNDTMSYDNWGVELGFAFGATENLELFLSALWQQIDAEFQVRASYAGTVDRDKLLHDGDDYGFTGGAVWKVAENWNLAGELYYSPLDVVRDPAGRAPSENDSLFNFRLALSWTLH